MPINKYGKTFWPNDEVTGVHIEFEHLGKEDHPKGGDDKFGIKVVLPKAMADGVDWHRALEDEEYRQSFASGSLMMHVDAMEKSLAMHPDCIQVEDFFGLKHDVSDIGIDTLLRGLMEDTAREQYEEEKGRGLVPHGLSFEDWCEIAGPDPDNMDLASWNPPGGKSH